MSDPFLGKNSAGRAPGRYIGDDPSSLPKEATMLTTTTKGYLVRRPQDAVTVPCPCGQSTRFVTRADTPVCNFHITFIQDSVRHFHKETTEVYYILQGQGKMELNGDVVDIEPGMVIYIEPYTWHRLESQEGVRTIVFGAPALRPDDEYFTADG
jgi:mannose-6-phosphate isomerase-like protein (cupin superfamily)